MYYYIIINYGQYRQNARAAQALYTAKLSHRHHLGKNTVIAHLRRKEILTIFLTVNVPIKANRVGVIASAADNLACQ